MLFEIGRSFGSLTHSPLHWVLQEAHRLARRPLEAGGNVKPDGGGSDQNLLPPDVGGAEVARAIEDLLRAQRFSSRKRSKDATPSLKMTSDGRAVVPADLLLLLGQGAADRGRQVIEEIVKELRHHRLLSRLSVRALVPKRR